VLGRLEQLIGCSDLFLRLNARLHSGNATMISPSRPNRDWTRPGPPLYFVDSVIVQVAADMGLLLIDYIYVWVCVKYDPDSSIRADAVCENDAARAGESGIVAGFSGQDGDFCADERTNCCCCFCEGGRSKCRKIESAEVLPISKRLLSRCYRDSYRSKNDDIKPARCANCARSYEDLASVFKRIDTARPP
jgi:hypothetical protein